MRRVLVSKSGKYHLGGRLFFSTDRVNAEDEKECRHQSDQYWPDPCDVGEELGKTEKREERSQGVEHTLPVAPEDSPGSRTDSSFLHQFAHLKMHPQDDEPKSRQTARSYSSWIHQKPPRKRTRQIHD